MREQSTRHPLRDAVELLAKAEKIVNDYQPKNEAERKELAGLDEDFEGIGYTLSLVIGP